MFDPPSHPRGRAGRAELWLGLVAPSLLMVAGMWCVRDFTIDDAYISFRYAENLVAGHGLVYNPGERIEGYTNLAWTLMIAAAVACGIDPHAAVKVVGGLSALALLWIAHRLSARLRPLAGTPSVATWLLASSPTTIGWAMYGLETASFALLLAWGLLWLLEEREQPQAWPRSALVFALAGLTRPETPAWLALAMLVALPRTAWFARQNLVRGLVFALPWAIHLGWRRVYYGAWWPSTLAAKTGDLGAQLVGGWSYVEAWIAQSGPLLAFALYAAALARIERRRDLGVTVALPVAIAVYVIVVGGDWMPLSRFMAPAEPLVFVAACVGIRRVLGVGDRAATLAMVALLAWSVVQRHGVLADARARILEQEKPFWDHAAGSVAEWLIARGGTGTVAMGDIGFVGHATGLPVLDLLGLVDPVISRLPGGYTAKIGPGFVERFYQVEPRWAVLVLGGYDCQRPAMPGVRAIVEDDRFARRYRLAENIRVGGDASWCVFERRAQRSADRE